MNIRLEMRLLLIALRESYMASQTREATGCPDSGVVHYCLFKWDYRIASAASASAVSADGGAATAIALTREYKIQRQRIDAGPELDLLVLVAASLGICHSELLVYPSKGRTTR